MTPGSRRPALPPCERPEVDVRIIGPVEVRGARRAFGRSAARDLVVFLALHPRGATTEQWATALWPDRLMAPATLHSTASVARRALGRSAQGDLHLPRGRGRLRLGPTVGTDWDRLRRLAAAGGPGDWRRGLSLVRGRPFDGLAGADWTVLDGFAASVEEAVVELARRLAEHELSVGDAEAAARAARAGLLASPGDERLYRLLFRAADAAGHPGGVEAAMAELLGLLGVDGANGSRRPGEPPPGVATAVHPATASLYRALSRRAAPGAVGLSL
jgi:DNA-binding SARP family transcriptional activator